MIPDGKGENARVQSWEEGPLAALREADPELYQGVMGELHRQRETVELIASENFVSPAVLAAMGSVLTNKYAEGTPGHRYYGGCEWIDVVEKLAQERVKALFGAEHANVQPHSGAQANLAAYWALIEPGDTILGMDLSQGGHLTHGSPANFSGRLYHVVSYGVDPDSEQIDYEAVAELAHQYKPKLIVAGASAYPRRIDFARFHEIAEEIGALLMVDMAHIAGIVAVGRHPSPVPYADVVTSTTHKTLRGPRGGFILSSQRWRKAVDHAVFPGTQGGPLEHIIAAKAVAFHEAAQPAFAEYIDRVLANAQMLAQTLVQRGLRLVSGGTENHLLLVDLRPKGLTGIVAEQALDQAGITVNHNAIPFDPQKPTITSGIRIGTPAVTTRGMGLAEMQELGEIIADVLDHPQEEQVLQQGRERTRRMLERFPLYPQWGSGSEMS